MFLLPDWCSELELIDEVSSGLEGLGPVSGTHRNRHRCFSDIYPTGAVADPHRHELPLVASLGDYLEDLFLNQFVVCLVYKMSNTGFAGRMVTHSAEECDNPTRGWILYGGAQFGEGYWLLRNHYFVPILADSHMIELNARN